MALVATPTLAAVDYGGDETGQAPPVAARPLYVMAAGALAGAAVGYFVIRDRANPSSGNTQASLAGGATLGLLAGLGVNFLLPPSPTYVTQKGLGAGLQACLSF